MKRILLIAGLAAMAASASAETKVYFFKDRNGEFDQMGQVYGVSRNGEYAVIQDDENNEAFLWRLSDPEKLELLNNTRSDGKLIGTEVRDVNNNGTIVGSVLSGNQWQPFIKKLDGDKIPLPLTEKALNLNFPCAINDEETVIGGQIGGSITVPTQGSWGQSKPCFWSKGDDGEFEIFFDENLVLPEHDGTHVTCMYTMDGTLRNTFLGGNVGAGGGSYLPFLYRGTGELIMWNELTHKMIDFYFKGEVLRSHREELIDGLRDGFDGGNQWPFISAGFNTCDYAGNFYGARPEVYDVDPTEDVNSAEDQEKFGRAKVRYQRGWFNVYTNEWTAEEGGPDISVGIDGKVLFSGNNVYTDGLKGGSEAISTFVDASLAAPGTVRGVTRISGTGKVFGMMYTATDAMGATHAYPFMVVLDHDIVGVDNVVADPANKVAILTYGGTIEVAGANEVTVYDMNGVQVSNKAVSNVAGGTYIVVADGVSHKILVK